MWNFGIPYRLKHYFDVLVQPGYTFSSDRESGYTGLVTDKPVVVVYARGGDYSSGEATQCDLQKPYVETTLKFIGFTDVHPIVIEPTLAGWPDVASDCVSQAEATARELARSF
jgi:FMN-dependent NADH-azoreductase